VAQFAAMCGLAVNSLDPPLIANAYRPHYLRQAEANVSSHGYFERSWAASESRFEPEAAVKAWLARAKADFTAVIDRDARNATVLDYRGMTNENLGDYIAAIDDYTRVAALDGTLGTLRLADVYCRRGGTWIAQKA
jgi:hypothetical protein